jgi:GTP pyrophosphokinase
MPAYDCTNKDELYSKIGAGIITLDNLGSILKQNSSTKIQKFWKLLLTGSSDNESDDIDLDDVAPTLDATAHNGEDRVAEPDYVMAECCEPIPGDKVVGYRNPKSGRITIHKSTCDTIIRLAAQAGENIINESEIKWSQQRAISYLATIEVQGIDRAGIILDLTKVITTDFNINMRTISIHSHDGIFEGTISIYVRDIENLNVLMDNIRHIKGIDKVKRLLST